MPGDSKQNERSAHIEYRSLDLQLTTDQLTQLDCVDQLFYTDLTLVEIRQTISRFCNAEIVSNEANNIQNK